MAITTYTDVSAFKRDFFPDRADVQPNLILRAARMSFNAVNSLIGRFYSTIPFPLVSGGYPPAIVDISDWMTRGIVNSLILKKGIDKNKDVITAKEMLGKFAKNEATLYDADNVEIPRNSNIQSWTNLSDKLRIFDRDHEFDHEMTETDLDNLKRTRESH